MSRMRDELVAELRFDLDQALGFDADELASKRARALDYYNGVMASPPDGRSGVVSMDVADSVNAIMGQATQIYKGSNIEFPPESAEDEQAAQIESDVIKTVIENNDEFRIFEHATFDALLQGNGWIAVRALDESEVVVSRFVLPAGSAEVFEMYLAQFGEDVDYDMETDAQGQEVYTVSREVEARRLAIDAVPPEDMVYTGEESVGDIQKLRLVAQRKLYTRAELSEMGLSDEDIDAVPNHAEYSEVGQRARAGDYADTIGDEMSAQDVSVLKETWLCYWLADVEGNGKVSRYFIHLAGDVFVDDPQPISYVPYVTGTPMPMPHRVAGYGMYDQMRQVQDTKTGILRAYIDNLGVMNQSRVWYLKGEVDTDELLSGRLNGAVGVDRPDAIGALPSSDVGMQAITGLNYMDEVRASRGGAALDLTNSELQVAQSSAMAAAQEYSHKEKQAAWYCKNLANTLLRNTFILAHRVLREEIAEPIQAKIRGEWQEVNPAMWAPRRRARVVVGMSDSEKRQRVAGLSQVLGKLEEWVQSGYEGIMTDRERVYNAAVDWMRAAELTDHPEEYLINPMSPQAQQAAQQQAQQAAQQQAEMEAKQAQMIQQQNQQLQETELIKQAGENERQERDLAFKYFDTQVDAEIKEADLTVRHVEKMADIGRDQAQAGTREQ